MFLPSPTSHKKIFHRVSFRCVLFFLVVVVVINPFYLLGCKKTSTVKSVNSVEQAEKIDDLSDENPADVSENDTAVADNNSGEDANPEAQADGGDVAKDGEGYDFVGPLPAAKKPSGGAETKPDVAENLPKNQDNSDDTVAEIDSDGESDADVDSERGELPEGKEDGAVNANKGEEKNAGKVDKIAKEAIPPKEERPALTSPKPKKRIIKLKPAYLEIVSDFSKASATVNGLAYPSYQPPGTPRGVTLPAGGPYYIVVKYGQNTKSYEVYLRPYERRVIVADLTGFNGVARAPSANRPEPPKRDDENGKIIVYSKPDALVYLDGQKAADHTPATLEAKPGRHEVSVRYNESLRVSEIKPVRLRSNGTVRLYFREKKR